VTDIEYWGSWQNLQKLNNRTHEGQWHFWGWMHVSSLGQWHLFFEKNPICQVWTNQKCVLVGQTTLFSILSELSFPFPWDSASSINKFKHNIIISKRQSKRRGVTDIEYRGSWQNMYKLNNRTHEGQWHLFFEQKPTGQVWTNQKCVLVRRTALFWMISELRFSFSWDSARSIN